MMRLILQSSLVVSILTSTAFADDARSNTDGADDSLISVGVARIDVTPDGPIRLNGYAARKTESTGVAQRLWAKALAIGTDEQGPAILVTVDNCVVPSEVDGSMPTFDKPTRLALETEERIVSTVYSLLPGRTKTPRETSADPPGGRPNILWITCEDMSPNLGCYGDTYAVTPNLDRLAARGVRYTHAFSHAGVCAPSRSGLITGMYPTSLGSHHMRCSATLPGFVKCFPEYLRNAG